MLLFRKERLQEVHQLMLFKANQRLLLEWSIKQSNDMKEKTLPKSRTEVERLILEHQDWKVSINVNVLEVLQSLHQTWGKLSMFASRQRSTPAPSALTLSETLVWV